MFIKESSIYCFMFCSSCWPYFFLIFFLAFKFAIDSDKDAYDERRKEKNRIRETKHLLTNAESSTDTTVGWTKNTQKPKFFEKLKKSSKTQKLKNV